MEGMTVVAGIPVPSTSRWFLGVVAIHVVMGVVCVIAGAGAMLSAKRRGRHSSWGTVYYWLLVGVFVSATALSVVRWLDDWHLLVLGIMSIVSATIGRRAQRSAGLARTRLPIHVAGMAASYILMLTAFYVDNGRNLPVWWDLPSIVYWLGPAAVGLPLLAYVLVRHPLLRRARGTP